MLEEGLKFGPIGPSAMHLCIDMQQLFAEATPWHIPWMKRILPMVCAMTERAAEKTIFTRFIPPYNPEDAIGTWRRYYHRWEMMTLDKLDPALIELMPELRQFIPPASVFDKQVYGPWLNGQLHQKLQSNKIDTLLMTGGETDMCLMAAVSGAVDLGYRVIILKDAVCSASDTTHDEMLNIYSNRYGLQIEITDTEAVLSNWNPR